LAAFTGCPTAPRKSTPRWRLVMCPLKRRPVPNSLVTIEERGRRKAAVHIGGESWARLPTARARRFSRATRAAVAESRGRVNDLSTASVVDTGGGSLGSASRARTVSTLPDARVRITLATRLPSASTGTAPSACHAPAGDAMKWSGSPASAPRIETIESAGDAEAFSVRRTTAPGSGLAGAIERRELCAAREPDTRVQSATAVLMQVFTN
jgi:hypothetical protein